MQNESSIADIIERSGAHNGQRRGLMTGVHAAKVSCILSVRVDELFHSAALRLALPSFCSFLMELCKASYTQVNINQQVTHSNIVTFFAT